MTDIRSVEYVWLDDIRTVHRSDVVVGDGEITYDENYDEYDDRIFFYFRDEHEFQQACAGILEGADFMIVAVEE